MRLVTSRFDPATWRGQAACVGDMAAAFYPPLRPEKRSIKATREERAKAVCAACSVRVQCLEQAVDSGERYGIWGGLTDIERSRLRAS
jgi:WhiB family redox-sensing transcriptional regulator